MRVHVIGYSSAAGCRCWRWLATSMPQRHWRLRRIAAPLMIHVSLEAPAHAVEEHHLHTHTSSPARTHKHHQTAQYCLPCVKGRATLHFGAKKLALHITSYGRWVGWIKGSCRNTLPHAAPQWLLR